jgi:hypothetical protein
MASTSETGHAKNVANFESLIGFCKGYGAMFNPSNPLIKMEGLTTVLTNSKGCLDTLKVASVVYNNATNARELAFGPLKKLSTRIINALTASGASQQTIDDADTNHAKLQGRRMAPKKEEAPAKDGSTGEGSASYSVSQQSYDAQVENFAKLVETVSAEPKFTPNEPELQPAALNALLLTLKNHNTEVITATTALSNARINRDKVLYAASTGLHDVALATKAYVLSIYTKGSAEYKQIGGIRFTTI